MEILIKTVFYETHFRQVLKRLSVCHTCGRSFDLGECKTVFSFYKS